MVLVGHHRSAPVRLTMVFLKLFPARKDLQSLWGSWCLGCIARNSDQAWDGTCESAFLVSSQLILLQVIQASHFETNNSYYQIFRQDQISSRCLSLRMDSSLCFFDGRVPTSFISIFRLTCPHPVPSPRINPIPNTLSRVFLSPPAGNNNHYICKDTDCPCISFFSSSLIILKRIRSRDVCLFY